MGLVSVCAKFQLSSWSEKFVVVGGEHVTTVSNSNASCFRLELSWVALGFDNKNKNYPTKIYQKKAS